MRKINTILPKACYVFDEKWEISHELLKEWLSQLKMQNVKLKRGLVFLSFQFYIFNSSLTGVVHFVVDFHHFTVNNGVGEFFKVMVGSCQHIHQIFR